ncbi:Transmembrane protein [Biomphalaria glabrata]
MLVWSQVPVEKAGLLVRYILNELTHISIVKIPAPSTTAQMAYEMDIISNLQLVEASYTAPELVATLAWDATTIDGSPINEVLQRQLSSYLDGSLSNPDAETVVRTSKAPLHNMHSERALGMFDFQYHRVHNATVGDVLVGN